MKPRRRSTANQTPKDKKTSKELIELVPTQSQNIQREESIQLTTGYAKLSFNKKGLAIGAIVVVVALALMMGFMIASVVIGVNITKEVGIRNGALVPYHGNQSVLKTSTMTYNQPLSLYTPLSVIETTKTVTVNIKEESFAGQFQFEVVSFVYVKGLQLVFYGHTHMATIMGDGSVQLEPLVPFEGAKRDETSTSTGSATATSTSSGSTSVVTIDSCAWFSSSANSASNAGANVVLATSLSCPGSFGSLFGGEPFTGNFNGNGKTLSLNINGNGLFSSVQGTVQRLIFGGAVTGSGSCGGIAGIARAGALFSTSSFTGSISCAADASGNSIVGGIAGSLVSSSISAPVTFRKVISQGSHSAAGNAKLGGFFGSAVSAQAAFEDAFVDSAISQTSSGSAQTDLIGNTGSASYTPTGVICIVDNGSDSPREGCPPVERCPNFPEANNCGPSACFGCRDTSLDRSLRLTVNPPVLPNFDSNDDNCKFF